jgi:hypothetical protein
MEARPLVSPGEEFRIEKAATLNYRLWPMAGSWLGAYRGRTLHSIKSAVLLAAFHQLEILCFCIAAHLSLTASASRATAHHG